MKKLVIPLLVLILTSCQQEERYPVSIINPSEFLRKSEGIVIQADEIKSLRDQSDSLLPVLTMPRGDYFPSQLDDLDGDGSWDELFTVVDLAPAEKKKLYISFIEPSAYPDFPMRTNIRFADKKNNYICRPF